MLTMEENMVVEKMDIRSVSAPKFSEKLYRSWFMRKLVGLSWWFMNRLDGRRDKKICGFSLAKYVPSKFRQSMGATGSQATRYWILEDIFQGAQFSEDDRVIDIGCGKARVFAYLTEQGVRCHMHGVELNEEVASIAQKWCGKYPNISISSGDAFQIDYNDYSVLLLGRPFELPMLGRFIKKLEQELTRPVTIFIWSDQETGETLDGRAGWTLNRRGWVFRKRGLWVSRSPQRYSVWRYDPT
ncbi:MAG: class I SAM-dependent methyltransferase [Ruminococcaceae bacterium]|nr:class I SAM-dependent methyltransferase [Oscillospiraceae bacterium]